MSGGDPVESRPGFMAMLKRIEGNGVRAIIVETASLKAWNQNIAS